MTNSNILEIYLKTKYEKLARRCFTYISYDGPGKYDSPEREPTVF